MHGLLRTGLLPLRLRCLPGRLTALQLGAADEALLEQPLVTAEVGLHRIAVALCSQQLCAGRLCRRLVILRIELRQQLPCAHVLPDLDRTAQQLARHPKAQHRLNPRAHLARKLQTIPRGGRTDGEQLDRAHRFFWRGRTLTGAEHNRTPQPRNEPQPPLMKGFHVQDPTS